MFAWIIKTAYLVPSGFALTTAPQIPQLLSPDLLSLVIALGGGVAAVLAVATGSGLTLVGVMMAAALLPPAATVGIGLAWGDPMVAVNSGVLLTVNILAINFTGLVTLWYLGYRPQSWIKVSQSRTAILKRSVTLFVAILIISGVLWNASHSSIQRSQLEEALEEDVSELLSAEAYDEVTLLDVEVDHDQTSLFDDPEKVVVTVGHPPGESYPSLQSDITERIDRHTEDNIATEIQVTLVMSD